MASLKVGVVQQTCEPDAARNLGKSIAGIRKAHQHGAALVVLGELHRTPYFCQTEAVTAFDLAEAIPGPTTTRLGELARELQVVLVASVFERRAAGLYHNTAVVLERDGTLAGCYRKTHIPDDPGYYEKYYFTPGDLGIQPIATSVGKLGVLVCWDQWYPEAARLQALAGAELLIYPTAIGWNPSDDADEKQRQVEAWITVQRGHAIANGLPVIAVNRVGLEPGPPGGPGIDFWGHSFVAGCQGELLFEAPGHRAVTEVVTLDLARTEQVRRLWPFLRDRRIDLYGELTKRYRC